MSNHDAKTKADGAESASTAGLGVGLSVAELIARLSDLDQDARVEIGWSWTTAPVASCDAEDGPVVIEALLDKESRLKGFYALCIEDIAWAVKVLDAELPPGSRSKATADAIERAKWRVGILLKTPNVELTGSGQVYRPESSDRRERG